MVYEAVQVYSGTKLFRQNSPYFNQIYDDSAMSADESCVTGGISKGVL